jgi:ABC-type Mn2+/Zn2+ transport system ATPase subunit
MLELTEVTAGYRSSGEILRDVSLRLEPRQTLAVYGLNGSGKSTLLKVCAGLLTPKQGADWLKDSRDGFGEDINDPRA